ncbi:MAG TPA: glycosyltransferase family 4 protein [Actinomycetota bacterium]|nr:glycosyltransferase family 4 protein [Actinomycetota bacterium]
MIVENVPFAMDHRLSKQAETLLARGYRVSVITQRHPRNQLYRRTPELRLYEYPPPPESSHPLGYVVEYGYSMTMAWILALRARLAGRIDLVQICQPPDIYFPIGLMLRALGSRVIVDQRDLLPELYVSRYGKPRRSILWALRRFEKLGQRAAEHVVCVNDYLKDSAIERSGIAPDAVTVVRNGPVLARVVGASPDPELKRERGHMCCWVGMMGRQDRLDLLLRAIAHAVFRLGRTDCQFVLIGDGESFHETQALARELGLMEWVTFTGWLTEPDVFRYLATADLGLDASLQDEVSPVKALEYMAFGLPFAAFDLRETRALGGDAAAYAAPGDAEELGAIIHSLLGDEQQRRRMGELGRRRVREELSWERQALRYVDVIEGLHPGGSLRSQGDPGTRSELKAGAADGGGRLD